MNEHIERMYNLLSHHITSLQSNGLLSLEEQVHVSEIIGNLCSGIVSLKMVERKNHGEGWKGE
jgi:hypothetical protein